MSPSPTLIIAAANIPALRLLPQTLLTSVPPTCAGIPAPSDIWRGTACPAPALEYVESSAGLQPPTLDGGRTEFEMADVNLDGKVNIDDLFAVLAAWGTCDDCPEDINDDGKVNIDDVFEILGAWGPCDGCLEDVDDNGQVNIDDLFAVLGAWGPCP